MSEDLNFEKFRLIDGDGWKKVSSEETYRDPYIQIERATYHSPSRPGEPVEWTIAHRKSAIAVAAKDEQGRWLMIHQERYPVQSTLWEFPAGQIDELENREDTDVIVATVHQELQEETGYRLSQNGQLFPLGYFFSSQGFTTEHVYLFFATEVELSDIPRSEVGGERIPNLSVFSDEELVELVASGEIRDALSLALFARLTAKGFLRPMGG